ncbi:MAG: riboflavin synthase [Victivallaceae bacterium]|nr:riboflavin synthase [Victivallaceae bacterium]
MFTGLIETTAKLTGRTISGKSGKLTVKPDNKFTELQRGESIAVNGACLTLEQKLTGGELEFHVLAETLKRTNLGELPVGAKINLERALAIGDRLGGHLVTGHIDTVGRVIDINCQDNDYVYKVSAPAEILPFLVQKGSIAIDGTSLTLVEIGEDYFTIHLIPVTSEDTALLARHPGDNVNLEADLLGKYVKRQLEMVGVSSGTDSVTMNTLRNAGWL